jgi:hypothetical protein
MALSRFGHVIELGIPTIDGTHDLKENAVLRVQYADIPSSEKATNY